VNAQCASWWGMDLSMPRAWCARASCRRVTAHAASNQRNGFGQACSCETGKIRARSNMGQTTHSTKGVVGHDLRGRTKRFSIHLELRARALRGWDVHQDLIRRSFRRQIFVLFVHTAHLQRKLELGLCTACECKVSAGGNQIIKLLCEVDVGSP